MKHSNRFIFGSLTFALTMVLLWSCVQPSGTVQEPLTSLDKEIEEIRPGILEGYLPHEKMPNSLLLVSPPPEEGSAALELDMDAAKRELEALEI
jgi:hypothetical protein